MGKKNCINIIFFFLFLLMNIYNFFCIIYTFFSRTSIFCFLCSFVHFLYFITLPLQFFKLKNKKNIMKNLIFLSEGENQRELNEKIGVYFLNYLFLHNLSFHSLYIYIYIYFFFSWIWIFRILYKRFILYIAFLLHTITYFSK